MTDRTERDCDRCGLTVNLKEKEADHHWKSCSGIEKNGDTPEFNVYHLCPECWDRAIEPKRETHFVQKYGAQKKVE